MLILVVGCDKVNIPLFTLDCLCIATPVLLSLLVLSLFALSVVIIIRAGISRVIIIPFRITCFGREVVGWAVCTVISILTFS